MTGARYHSTIMWMFQWMLNVPEATTDLFELKKTYLKSEISNPRSIDTKKEKNNISNWIKNKSPEGIYFENTRQPNGC